MDIREYDKILPAGVSVGSEIIGRICARQGQFFTKPGVVQSPFMNKQLLSELRGLIDVAPYYDSGLLEMRTKARGKWYGKQGQTCDESAYVAALNEYYPITIPRVDYPLSPQVQEALRVIFTRARGLQWDMSRELAFKADGGWFRKKNSNTGYLDFTSDPEGRSRAFDKALTIASRSWWDATMYHPAIAWYRHQRNKYRCIFGDSLANLAMAKAVGHEFFEVIPYHISEIAWTSPEKTYDAFRTFAYKRRNMKLVAFEGDYKAMDQHFSLPLALYTLEQVARAIDLDMYHYDNLAQLLNMFFYQPLVDYECTVRTELHNLFSGQFITNPIECYANIICQLCFLELLCEEAHVDFWSVFPDVFIRVMGDDSVIVLPDLGIADERYGELFREVASRFSLEVEPSKCRVSRESFWFCKHGYLFDWSKGKFKGSIAIPAYPIDCALLNVEYPEEGPRVDSKLQFPYSQELLCIAARLDDAAGDPAFEAVVKRWAQEYGPREILQGISYATLQGKKPYSDYLAEIGLVDEWRAATSPTVVLIRKLI